MFNFLSMMGNYEQRRVANYIPKGKKEWLVDTAAVNDSSQPYETAVKHPRFNNGKMVIVELYETKELAQKGHDKWVKKMTAKKLPVSLKDVSTADVAMLLSEVSDDKWRSIKKPTPIKVDNHEVIPNKDGSLKVGCKTISKEDFEEIVRQREEVMKS